MSQPSNNTRRERIWGLDAAKAVAAFLVVIYHASRLDVGVFRDGTYTPSFAIAVWMICVCGVPLFFMISGALGMSRPTTTKQVVIKVSRLVFVAVFWTIVLDNVITVSITGRDIPIFPRIIDHYWFFYALAGLYVCNHVLGRLNTVWRKVLTALLLLCPFLTNFVWMLVICFDQTVVLPAWGRDGLFVSYSLVYYHIGHYLLNHRPSRFGTWLMFLGGWALFVFDMSVMSAHCQHLFDISNSIATLGALFMSCGLFSLLMRLKCELSWLARVVTVIGRNALGIYLFQFFVIDMYNIFLRGSDFQHPFELIVVTLLVMTICVGLSELVKHSPLKFAMRL